MNSFERKPLGQERIHPSESLPRVQKKNLSTKRVRKKTSRPRKNSPKWILAESTKEKPLGQESLKENLSAKEEFTQVNPCREYERKPLGQESSKENLSAKEEFIQVNPCREYKRKTSRPLGQESSKEKLSAKEEFTRVNPCREYERKTSRPRELERKPLGQGRIHPSESLPRVRKKTSRPRKNSPKWIPVESTKENSFGLSAKRVRKKTSLPKTTSSVRLSPHSTSSNRAITNTLSMRTLTTIRLYVMFKPTHSSLGGICTTGWPKGQPDDKAD